MDLEAKLKKLEELASTLEVALADKEKTIKDLESQIAVLTEKNKELDKALTIEREKVLALEAKAREEREVKVANGIISSILAESNIPERLHAKIMNYIDYRKFKSEGEFTADSEDAKRFAEAVKAEVADFEQALGSVTSIGASEEKKHGFVSSADEAFAKAKAETDEILGIKNR